MSKTLDAFIDRLRRSGVLSPERINEAISLAPGLKNDPKLLAKRIVQKGWLTQFQMKMIWHDRAKDLYLGQYLLIDKIGEGAMGQVYRAEHVRMGREVAVKVIRKERLENREAVRRFEREIQVVSQLSHENIVLAYDAGKQSGVHFFAMELVKGITLQEKVEAHGPLSEAEAINYLRQAAFGLDHANERGLVHRDIKPGNLLLNQQGVIKLLDMGLSRLKDAIGEVHTRITQEGLVVGTPDYISPEQARNSQSADIRSDLYSLACTFYYLLTLEPPYNGPSAIEIMLAHANAPIPDVRAKRPDLSLAFATILHQMMEKRPEDRYQTPGDLIRVLAQFQSSEEREAFGEEFFRPDVHNQKKPDEGFSLTSFGNLFPSTEPEPEPSNYKKIAFFAGLGLFLVVGIVVTLILIM
jgi:eukaryotic-like serine/threonine-protein kinase